ncbi:MAG TPA: Gfo/Idh/MocA family oxidoreductase [Actinomycetes bacterium]|nr:Gfo/Idh/MocA family oxidoreductase [Actinomycetes bacterium]
MTRIGIAGATGKQGQRWFQTVHEAEEGFGMFLGRCMPEDGLNTRSPEEFVAGSDRIIIATPVASHFDIASAALRAGKPVLCEKPLAPTYQQAASLYDTASRYWTRLWTCYPHLWHPVIEQMRKRTKLDLEITFCGPTEAEPLLDWAPHALSVALYLLGTDALLKTKILTSDHKRASCEIESNLGRAFCTFGLSPVKRVHVQLKNQPRLYYNGENCHPTTMQRMLAGWLKPEDDPRGAPDLTLGVHEILEEVMR